MAVVATGAALLGQGGGVLYTPVQIFFGIKFHTAATSSLFLIMVTSLSATLVFRKASKIDWPLAIVLESVTAWGGLMGALVSDRFSEALLSAIFAGVAAFAAVFMIWEFRTRSVCPPLKRGWAYWHRRFGERVYCVNLFVALPLAFVAGGISGLLGIGGGVLKVPLMVLLLGIPMDVAVGSSGFMVGLTAAGGFAGHAAIGHWDWRTSLILAGAVFVGARLGARRSIEIDKKKLRKGFGWFLMAVAGIMAAKALF